MLQKKNFLKPYGLFLWIRFNRLKDKDPGVPGTHFISLERMKVKSTLEPLTGFEPRSPGLEIQHFSH